MMHQVTRRSSRRTTRSAAPVRRSCLRNQEVGLTQASAAAVDVARDRHAVSGLRHRLRSGIHGDVIDDNRVMACRADAVVLDLAGDLGDAIAQSEEADRVWRRAVTVDGIKDGVVVEHHRGSAEIRLRDDRFRPIALERVAGDCQVRHTHVLNPIRMRPTAGLGEIVNEVAS